MRKYTYTDVVKAFEKTEYQLLSSEDEYINCSVNNIRYICPHHSDKGELTISLSHLLDGRGCYYCGRERTNKKRLIEFNKESDRLLCESKGFKYVDTYRDDGIIYISFICGKHIELGVQSMRKSNMKRDIKGCKYCCGKQLPEWYVLQKAKEVNPYIQLLEPYVNLTTRMLCKCKKHNVESRKSMQEILSGRGCIQCGCEKVSQFQSLSLEEYQQRVDKNNDHIIVLDYISMKDDATFKCKKCGHIWSSSAAVPTMYNRQCPNCENYYYGEKCVGEFLDEFDIKYITHYSFDNCRDRKPLPFDFYLYEYNTCIEYDGEQHFKEIPEWGDYNIIKLHDQIKNTYCHRHNIKLIRIPHWELDDLKYYLFDKLVKNNILEEICA